MKINRSGRLKVYAFLAIGLVGGLLAAGPFHPAFAKAFAGQPGVRPNVVFTSNSSAAAIKGINNGSGFAVEGQAATSAGIFGQSVSGGGIVGLSTSGFGLTGTSTSNIGLNGTSSTNSGVGGSTHADFPFAGVFGTSLSPDFNAVGVAGEQGANGFGVAGTCNTGNTGFCTGVTGQTIGTNGIAVSAFSANAAPSAGYTPSPAMMIDAFGGGPALAVQVVATSAPVLTIDGNGQEFMGAANNGRPLETDASGLAGDSLDVFTDAPNAGEAFLGTASGVGATVEGFAVSGGPPALQITEEDGSNAIIATDEHTCFCDIMSLDPAGNMILLGGLTTFTSPLVATKTATGREVDTYGARQSEPTVEDFGQGQLVNGFASVAIDPAFAATMDARRPYLVFITPDGDSRGLYTTEKTPRGFVVRENGGGRSSLAFDYRIVGKPFGNNEARLPMARPMERPSTSDIAFERTIRNQKMHPTHPHAYHVTPLPKRMFTRP